MQEAGPQQQLLQMVEQLPPEPPALDNDADAQVLFVVVAPTPATVCARKQIIRHARTHYVGKYQSCMV